MSSTFLSDEKNVKRFVTYERVVLVFSVFFLLLGIGLIYLLLFPEILTQSFVPLHYNVHSGVDRYGAWWRIFTIPAFGTAFLIINLLIARYGVRKNPLLHAFLYTITLLTEFILFVALIFIIFLNISFYG